MNWINLLPNNNIIIAMIANNNKKLTILTSSTGLTIYNNFLTVIYIVTLKIIVNNNEFNKYTMQYVRVWTLTKRQNCEF